MSGSTIIRSARPEDAKYLSELAMRSKAYWGYSIEFMESCRAELTVAENHISSDRFEFAVAEEDGLIVGFYGLEAKSERVFELESLFIEPSRIGCGIGSLLMQHALRSLHRKGVEKLVIQGDPHATEFYSAAGATLIGTRESGSIPGRLLPLFQISIRSPTPDTA